MITKTIKPGRYLFSFPDDLVSMLLLVMSALFGFVPSSIGSVIYVTVGFVIDSRQLQ